MQLVLLYHAVMDIPADLPNESRVLVVEPGELEWQFGELARRGFRTLTLEEFYRGDDNPFGILLTFDDAYADSIDAVTPMLAKHGQTAVLFPPWAYLGGTNDWDKAEVPVGGLAVAGPAELRAAVETGHWELGAHGTRHVDLRTLEPGERLHQLVECRENLSELAGREVLDLAYPFGRYDDNVQDDARRAGFRMAFTAVPDAPDGPYSISRLAIRGQEGRRAFTVKTDPQFRHLFK